MRPPLRFVIADARFPDGDAPYVKKIKDLALRPDFDYEIEVRHDDWCRALSGGFCSCDPDIIVVSGRPRAAVDRGISE
jgi:hypothetical protein